MFKEKIIVNPENPPDQYPLFQEWFSQFVNRCGGISPKKIERWYKQVDATHSSIREFIGGIRREFIFALKSQQNPADYSTSRPLIDQILELLPEYLESYGYDRKIFLLPTISQGSHSAFRTSKHIRTHAEQQWKGKLDREGRLKKLDGLLAELGQVYVKSKTSDIELEATITTSQRGFILLGHYGPDQDSCWRHGSDKTLDKFCVGQTPNSFIITIAKRHPKKPERWLNTARCFGFTSKNHTILNVSNYYASPGFQEGDGIETIRSVAEALFQDKCEFHEEKILIDNDGGSGLGIFHNPYGRWSFAKGEGSALEETQVFVPDLNLIKLFCCKKCGVNRKTDNHWEDVDNEWTCENCCYNANVCEVTQQKTFKKLVGFLTSNNEYVLVHPDFAAKHHSCDICQTHHENVFETGGQQICQSCQENDYLQCHGCNLLLSENEFPCGDEYCTNCIKQGFLPMEFDEIDLTF